MRKVGNSNVAVIIPTLNEEKGIESTLRELREALEDPFYLVVDGGRGWLGDMKAILLSADRLFNLGWKPSLNSEEAVRQDCRELLRSMKEIGGSAR